MSNQDHNPSRTHRVRDYAYAYATHIARARGNFCRPSDVMNEIIDLGREADMRARKQNSSPTK
jgi:hypothetical protein